MYPCAEKIQILSYLILSKTQGLWYIDSTATRHMTFVKSQFKDYHTFPDHEKPSINLGNDYVVNAVGEGKLRLANDNNGTVLGLQKVAYFPELTSFPFRP